MTVSAEQNHGSKCSQCGEEIKEQVSRKIYYRTTREVWDNWKKRYVRKSVCATKVLKFCSERCGGHYQMAMEG